VLNFKEEITKMKKQFKHRLICWLTTLALLATMFAVPMAASAADAGAIWTAPTASAKVPDSKVAKVGAHAAATTAVHYLGGNLVTERATDLKDGAGVVITETPQSPGTTPADAYDRIKTNLEFGIFGTDINVSPDPYLYNYLYNFYRAAQGDSISQDINQVTPFSAASPADADTVIVQSMDTSVTLWHRPDVLYGISTPAAKAQTVSSVSGGAIEVTTASIAWSYDSLLALLPENYGKKQYPYDPVQVPVGMVSIYDQVKTMHDLAAAINETGKTGRYGDPEVIATQYEKYLKGLQLYILSKINDGTITKKTAAVFNPQPVASGEHAGEYILLNVFTSAGTAATCRTAEYVEHTTNNLIDVLKIPNSGTRSKPAYYATAEQLVQADVLLADGMADLGAGKTNINKIKATEIKDDLVAKNVPANKIPPILAIVPDTSFGIVMNSVENIIGIPVSNGFIYPEVLDPVQGTMYIYDNFWHVKDKATIVSLADANFALADVPDGIDKNPSAYNKAQIETLVTKGLQYYKENESVLSEGKLRLSSELAKSASARPDISTATVTAPNATYTGKAVKTALTVKIGSTTLKENTDYTAAYTNNINLGTATVTLTGKDNYRGTKTATFKITAPIPGASIAKIADVTYTGKAVTPAVKVTVNGKTLVKDTDYTVVYSKNTAIGTASVTVSGKGNYTGTNQATFKIVKPVVAKVTGHKLKAAKKSFTTSWTKHKTATGYEVQYTTDKKFKKSIKKINVKKVGTVKYKVKKLKAKKTYYVKVRAYKTIAGKKFYSGWSKVKKIKTKK
jgi:hypothetical protein